MRFQGKLLNWNDVKGTGTIIWNGGNDRVFVHISAFTHGRKRPKNGDIVTYEVEKEKNGKFKAINVSFPQSQLGIVKKRPKASSGIFIGIVTTIFIVYLLGSLVTGRIPQVLLGIYAAVSIISFITYVIDKNAAEKNRWRVQENTLHIMALFGGWPGAYIAQRITRHKTVKEPFQSVFVATVILNIIALIVYSSPTATSALLALLAR